ncbi:hypothetical protein [Nodosilinea sp. E11]|uniref:hypothetical protein n=1 Tax=Nodosilinea sp. E11 TaxID=3037479 RepID=UPI0029345812|nr:hypothetical protein [Nodosilinea sp. E11]WOD37551.1 hypothetical protein RRF56_15180 [Nodosilinea sp. E11]
MQRLISLIQSVSSRRLRSLVLLGFASITSWLMMAHQPAYAAQAQSPSTPVDQVMTEEPREQAYEEALDVIDDPNGVQKAYKANLKQYRQQNPEEGGVVNNAKDLVEKITPGRK